MEEGEDREEEEEEESRAVGAGVGIMMGWSAAWNDYNMYKE